MQSIFETLRNVLHEANIDKRVQYMVEVMFAVRKDGFKQHPAVMEELDKCEEEDQFTHALQLDDDLKGDEGLNVFKPGIAWGACEEGINILTLTRYNVGACARFDVCLWSRHAGYA